MSLRQSPMAGPGLAWCGSPKRSDWRDVPLTRAATACLHRQEDRYREQFGKKPPRSKYVFGGSGDDVDQMRPDALSRRWTAARGTLSITLLDLRHFVPPNGGGRGAPRPLPRPLHAWRTRRVQSDGTDPKLSFCKTEHARISRGAEAPPLHRIRTRTVSGTTGVSRQTADF